MPRVLTKTKSTRGAEYVCGSPGCGRVIAPGESYYSWTFRYGGTQVRCAEHPPRRSETTQSKLSEVYAAIEDAEEQLPGAETGEDLTSLVQEVAERVRAVSEEYREAAENFGGGGENAERADELEGWADELDGFEVEEEDNDEQREAAVKDIVAEYAIAPPFTERPADVALEDIIDFSDLDAVIAVFMIDEAILEERIREIAEREGNDPLEASRSTASELLGSCPL